MKWFLTVGLFLGCAELSLSSAIRCKPGDKDESCITEPTEKDLKYPELVTYEEVGTEVECLAGSEWESNCHSCRCSDEGRAQCTKQKICDKEYGEPLRCKPNTSFKRVCSTCMCLDNGVGLCTMNDCVRISRPPVPKKSELSSGKECSAGSKWRSQCNECSCSEEGYSKCSQQDCPGQENEPQLSCAPDTVWKNECNTCWCTSDGRAMCTRMGCSVGTHIVTEWNPKPTTGTDTNNIAKRSALNTTKAVVCAANRMFIKDCNTCWCNEDGTSFFCTRKSCINIPEESEDVKNSAKKSPASSQVSLRRKRSSSQGTPKTCQPGLEFRMDCNKCLCDNEGQNFSCTRMDCAALNSNGNGGDRSKREVTSRNQTDCTPGSVFEQGCNVCRCTSDGNHATCTMKICQETSENDINAPESDPSFRCNPGEQFKRGCKDCTCSADGKSVFCTLRICDELTAL